MPFSAPVPGIAAYSAEECDQLARELFARHGDFLLALARRRIGAGLTRRIDPEDIVQSAFRTFFNRYRQGEFPITDPDDLGRLLVHITIRKALKQIAHQKAAKRDPASETHGTDDILRHVPSREADPETSVAFVEQFEALMAQLGDEDRRILSMRLDGHSNRDIETALNIYERKIRRVIERIRGLAIREGILDPRHHSE